MARSPAADTLALVIAAILLGGLVKGVAGLGLASGAVFGATNVAVQVVAYLDGLDLDRPTFVGVIARVLVGISAVRVGAAWTLGPRSGIAARLTTARLVAAAMAGIATGSPGRCIPVWLTPV